MTLIFDLSNIHIYGIRIKKGVGNLSFLSVSNLNNVLLLRMSEAPLFVMLKLRKYKIAQKNAIHQN